MRSRACSRADRRQAARRILVAAGFSLLLAVGSTNPSAGAAASGRPGALPARLEQPTSFAYEPSFSQLASVTDPLQHTTRYGYDGRGALVSVTDPRGKTTTFTPDSRGQPTSLTDPLGNRTRLKYEAGDLGTVIDPLGNSVRTFTDAVGRPLSVTDSRGNVTRRTYSPLNLVTKVRDAARGETSFAYDENGNLTGVTDARGKTTSYGYDAMDRLVSRTDPLGRSESYGYDGSGNLVRHTDRDGIVTRYRYDPLDRLVFTGFRETGSPEAPAYESTLSYAYDDGDGLTRAVDSSAGAIDRAYDALDRLTLETTPAGTVAYGYDAAPGDGRPCSSPASRRSATPTTPPTT
jgi:YD repeat-containing protein